MNNHPVFRMHDNDSRPIFSALWYEWPEKALDGLLRYSSVIIVNEFDVRFDIGRFTSAEPNCRHFHARSTIDKRPIEMVIPIDGCHFIKLTFISILIRLSQTNSLFHFEFQYDCVYFLMNFVDCHDNIDGKIETKVSISCDLSLSVLLIFGGGAFVLFGKACFRRVNGHWKWHSGGPT